MLKALDDFAVVEHPHAEVSGLIPPNDMADPDGCLDRDHYGALAKITDLVAAAATLSEMQATLTRIMALVKDDHDKIHALERRVKEKENQLHMIPSAS